MKVANAQIGDQFGPELVLILDLGKSVKSYAEAVNAFLVEFFLEVICSQLFILNRLLNELGGILRDLHL